jgi:hypothetical protein
MEAIARTEKPIAGRGSKLEACKGKKPFVGHRTNRTCPDMSSASTKDGCRTDRTSPYKGMSGVRCPVDQRTGMACRMPRPSILPLLAIPSRVPRGLQEGGGYDN